MRIAIEAQRIFRAEKHGMDFVVLESIKELQKLDFENEYFIFVAPGPDHCLKETKNFKIITLKSNFYPYWEQIAFPNALRRFKPDIVHCTSNTAPLRCKYPLILTLHDIIFLEPQREKSKSTYQRLGRIYRHYVVPAIIPICKKIITVSKYKENHITKSLNLTKQKVTYIYNGFSHNLKGAEPDQAIIHKYIKAKDYLFLLGSKDPRKNIPKILRAYTKYFNLSEKKMPLLVTGMTKKEIKEILQESYNLEIESHIFYTGYLSDNDLSNILGGAKVFLFISLVEGFGIPILESMANGTPVITSNTTSMPEIAGEKGITVSPNDENAIAQKIITLETDEIFYKEQVKYGYEHVNKFSWANTAKELLQLYKTIYASL